MIDYKIEYDKFVENAKQKPQTKFFIVDGPQRSGNNFWNNLFSSNLVHGDFEVGDFAFHLPSLYFQDNVYNFQENIINVVPFRDPWEGLKSFLLLTNEEETATEKFMIDYLESSLDFYNMVLSDNKNIIPIDLDFGSLYPNNIVSKIFSINIEEVSNPFEDYAIKERDTDRENATPRYTRQKQALINKAAKRIYTDKVIKYATEVSAKYYEAKLFSYNFWKERGL
jgi:hypothetical protein